MIIKRAEQNEKAGEPFFGEWGYIKFSHNDNIYRVVFEHTFYGYTIRQWSVNGDTESTVQSKYFEGEYVSFCCSAGLGGVRAFENDSIVYEFLLKPLGLPVTDNKCLGRHQLIALMDENNISYQLII